MRTEEMLWAGLHAGPVQVLWKETAIKISIWIKTIHNKDDNANYNNITNIIINSLKKCVVIIYKCAVDLSILTDLEWLLKFHSYCP